MIAKSYKDDDVELVIQQNETDMKCSVSMIYNNNQVEFHGGLDMEAALDVYDYLFDKIKGNDLSDWEIT